GIRYLIVTGVQTCALPISAAFALDRISFAIPAGEYGVLMGRTGSGKTTILETICGLRSAVSGCIKLAGEDVTRRKPAERRIGYEIGRASCREREWHEVVGG